MNRILPLAQHATESEFAELSRFTKHHREKVDGWNSDAPIFRELIERVRPEVIVEVGSWKGASAIHMAKICKELGLDTKIYCVDTWLGAPEFWKNQNGGERDLFQKFGYPSVYFHFAANVHDAGFAGEIYPVPVPSSIGAKLIPDADLIYIDGDHSRKAVNDDIQAFWPKLTAGGAMFGDDYNNAAFEVREGVADALPLKSRGLFDTRPSFHNGNKRDDWFWIINKI